jgi:hypothetical protein
MCGASGAMKDIGKQQSTFMSTLMNQSGQVFGDASQIFGDLTSAFAPIVAAGPQQEGFSPAEKAAMTASVVDSEGQAARNAKAATGNAVAAVGGGNTVLPNGTEAAINSKVNEDFAQKTASGEQEITREDWATGRQNFDLASKALSGATDVFNASTGAAGAATGAGKAAADTQQEISQADNSWMTPVAGILGGVAGVATGGIMKHEGWA